MLLRRALPAAHQSLAHPFPIYEVRSKEPQAQPAHAPLLRAAGVYEPRETILNDIKRFAGRVVVRRIAGDS